MMIFPPRDPNNPKGVQMRSLIIIGLLIVAAGLATFRTMNNDVDRIILKRAEEVCGEGNVKQVTATDFTCGTPDEEE